MIFTDLLSELCSSILIIFTSHLIDLLCSNQNKCSQLFLSFKTNSSSKSLTSLSLTHPNSRKYPLELNQTIVRVVPLALRDMHKWEMYKMSKLVVMDKLRGLILGFAYWIYKTLQKKCYYSPDLNLFWPEMKFPLYEFLLNIVY